MISSVNPSASGFKSALLPVYLNGSTATQKPSLVRDSPEAVPAAIRPEESAEDGAASSLTSKPALRSPSIRRSTSSGSYRDRHAGPTIWAAWGFSLSSSCTDFAGFLLLAKLPVDCREHRMGPEKVWQIDFERITQRGLVVVLAVGIHRKRKPVPAGMIRIQLQSALHQPAAALPFAGVGDKAAQVGNIASIQRIERDRPVGRSSESRYLFSVKVSDGEGVVAAMTGGIEFDGAARSFEHALQGIRLSG